MNLNQEKQQPTIHTERLILRPFMLSDAPEVQRLASDRAIAAVTLTIPHPYEDGMAEDWIKTHSKAFVEGKEVVFAITFPETNILCGAIGLLINREHNRAELGYWIGQPFWGNGYCTEAALAIVKYGFESLGLHRIHSSHFSSNPASGRVMQKIGMRYEGCLRQHLLKWGNFEDRVQYGILKSEWKI
ncbi:GNAT family N-acetyltransferase [Aerosakkonemataceae cyanobacterium BLCC-F154]|uniref:GNAT family N-acetyltransferase n=1 Tax=Floridaenema fluviatile BLCC-F154 TaxID=3153640 RepID=A0ABV4Y730_9CYAN